VIGSKKSRPGSRAGGSSFDEVGTSAAVFCTSSRAQKSVVDFTDFDEAGTGPGGNIARFEEAA
jgi:hypothetical protein